MNPISQRQPTTTAQYGIWMAQQMVPESPSYLTGEAIELKGKLDRKALSDSVVAVLNHCSTLHMRFEIDNEGLWQWPQPLSEAPPEYHDMRQQPDPDAAAQAWMRQSLNTLCRPTEDPLYRSAVLQVADNRHLWFLQVHHIALDGYGYSLICQAVAARYSATVNQQPLPELPDWKLDKVIEAEQRYKANGGFERDRNFWVEHLQHVPAPAVIAEPQEFSDAVRRHSSRLSEAEIASLQQAAQRCGQDWGSWMLAAIGMWLARHSGQRQLTFGLPVMNRLGTPALNVPCMAMNIVPMSVYVDPEHSMQQMGQALAGHMRKIRPHLYYRYGWIRGDLGLLEAQKHLFNQAVNIMPFDRHAPFAGLESSIHPVSAGPVKDLNISVFVLNAEWQLLLEGNPYGYSDAHLAELHADLLKWLKTLAAHPHDATLAPLLEQLPALSILQGNSLAAEPRPVIRRLIEAAAGNPGKTALEHENGSLSYQALLQEVSALAATLQSGGLQAQDRVVILLPRSSQAIVAILACLWTGACYVPVDPTGPASRLDMVLKDCAPQRIVTLTCWAESAGDIPVLCLDQVDLENPADTTCPPPYMPADDDPAYLLYTSGSTGKPNGVMMGHGALAHFVESAGSLYGIEASDRMLQFAPLHFDASIEEIFLALCHGATLILRSDAVLESIQAFTSFVEQAAISILDLPTAYWHELAHALSPASAVQLASVRLTIIGGEAALPERARRWRDQLPGNVLCNSYGPTEASIIATTANLGGKDAVWDGGDQLPIGRPRPSVTALVVDEQGYLQAEGRPGELLLCGPALALGYYQNPELTARRFIQPQHLPGIARAYRTGDKVCLQNGQLMFLGRLDNEVKISGLRIDPAEVENALLANPVVREAAVLAQARKPSGYVLVAFVSCTEEVTSQQLKQALASILPDPAIPDRWHFLSQLPRNLNNKIDRKQLQELMTIAEPASLPQASPVEQQIMQVWHEVLGEMPQDVDANFFDLGGKSLQAIQVSNKLGLLLQREIPISALFQHATVQALARALNAPAAHRPPPASADLAFAPVLPIQRGTAPALFCLHPAEGLSWCYLPLAQYLPGVAIHGLQAVPDALPDSFDDMVEQYVARICAQQPHGPYHLLGWSLGGGLAQAMAARLQAMGKQVGMVALMDSYPASAFAAWRAPQLQDALITLLSVTGEVEADTPETIYQRLLRPGSPLAVLGRDRLEQMGQAALHGMQLFRSSSTPRYQGDILLFQAAQRGEEVPDPASWQPYIDGQMQCITLDCNHFGMSDPGPMRVIGAEITKYIDISAREEAA
ncbi:amino acid adenylation domain-containing protein [Methylobacillus rhizosphaerae]|uniref:Amino acid adenylation domain-containing protein n=1 Tax=Methylobacillus rhizosphaerae TaxID=551994 RepID=A0A238YZ82_9PROT|nr:non-ribosomal peptide synthetase [Methylobacillus rhizosphaerae]SNR75849.1 amino acid adenylation domain-containing protein [Methylobacillus rhizosphaerae]